MKKPSIAFIGDLTVDRYVEKNEIRLGGAALNMAIWAKRSGADVSVVTDVGSDDAGKQQIAFLKQEKIDTSKIQISKGSTSEIEIFVNESGERRYGLWNAGTLAHYHLRTSDISFLKKKDVVCLTIYPQYEHILSEVSSIARAKKHPLLVVNFGDLREFNRDIRVVEDVLHYTDICVFGLDKDADETLINTLQHMAKQSRVKILITLASSGSLVFDGADVFLQAAKKVKVVDTTGAGDAFLAGFLVKYLKTKDIQTSLSAGSALASQVIQKVGAY